MVNFTYCTPTKLIFGKEAIKNLPEALAPFGKKVLLTYGGGSIKKIGLYDRIRKLLEGFEVFELPGIEPNPKIHHQRFKRREDLQRAEDQCGSGSGRRKRVGLL